MAVCSADSSGVAITSAPPKLFDLSTRAKLRVAGADRARYLNGQITNDIRKASGERAIHAAVLNVKGRMEADVFIHQAGDSFLVDAEGAVGEELRGRLERYVIADDVQIEEVSDDFGLFHLIDSTQDGVAAERFGRAGVDLWISKGDRDAKWSALAGTSDVFDEDRAEMFRIERGVPRWGFELSTEIIPVEANLESAAIDYAKGCYIGQEVISRMKMSGQTNKLLRGLVSVGGAPLRSGMRLVAPQDRTREIGWLTSTTRSDTLDKEIALGFVKRGFNDPGTSLLADGSTVEVIELPFL